MFTKFVKTCPDINILDATNPLSNIFQYATINIWKTLAEAERLSAVGRKRFGRRIKSDQRESGAFGDNVSPKRVSNHERGRRRIYLLITNMSDAS